MPRYTPDQQSDALAIYRTTGSLSAAAREIGCSISTVKAWVDRVELEDSEDAKSLDAEADRIADGIRHRQEKVRSELLDRMTKLIPSSDSLKDVATAFGIITDKLLLAQGKPTQIHGQSLALPADATPDELRTVADDLRERMQVGAP